MQILVTGGTGFIGSALCEALTEKNHQVIVLSRFPKKVNPLLTAISSLDEISIEQEIDAVINLAGEPIAAKRWSAAQKHKIRTSRLETTKSLIDFLSSRDKKPEVFISGSAIGYYGINLPNEDKNDNLVGENAKGDDSFSSQLCQDWETIALQAEQLGIRTCLLRTGVVLGSKGALARMLPPFKLCLGGKIGSGNQWMPWIHIKDILGIIIHCLEKENIQGPINAVAPNPINNAEFTQSLGKTINRPTPLPMPSLAVKLLMGQMGEELLLSGKQVIPQKILNSEYVFEFELLNEALRDILLTD